MSLDSTSSPNIKQSSSSDSSAGEFQLPVEGFTGTPEEIERQWYEKVYRGRGDSMKQLTVRAVIMGSLLGGILSLTNLYIGLKSGWGMGVAITACILSYAIWNALCQVAEVEFKISNVLRFLIDLLIPATVVSIGSAVLYWVEFRFIPAATIFTPFIYVAVIFISILLVRLILVVAMGKKPTRMTILENNCMQSCASSAGYSTGGTLISAFAAFIMLNGHAIPLGLTFAWVFFLAVLGVTMAVPMKKQMINIEQLRFPSGVAAAETLRALHSHGGKGLRAAKALGIAGVIAAIDNFIHDGFAAIPSLVRFSSDTLCTKFNEMFFGPLWMGRTVMFSWEPIFIASGAIMGMRVCISILLGSIVCWMIYVPELQQAGLLSLKGGFRDCVQWALWPGVSCMVFSSLLSLILQWRISLRAFAGLGKMFSRKSKTPNVTEAIETPMSWFAIGQGASLIALALLAHASFGMPYWQSAIAVVMSFALALVACRVTGETDTTPVGPMGKVTQLAFGALNPGNMNVNLMSANITAGAATSSADLLTDLKSGYLLGAHPRKQFLAQFAGIFIGTIVSVLAFTLVVDKPEVIGSDQFPSPAAQTWAAVAKALSQGFEALHPVKLWSIAIGGLVGMVFTILPLLFPKHEKYLPSASGFGLAWIFQWYYGVLFFMGAVIAWLFTKNWPKHSEEFTYPVASGVMAGGALMGVAIIFWQNGPEMWHKFLGH